MDMNILRDTSTMCGKGVKESTEGHGMLCYPWSRGPGNAQTRSVSVEKTIVD